MNYEVPKEENFSHNNWIIFTMPWVQKYFKVLNTSFLSHKSCLRFIVCKNSLVSQMSWYILFIPLRTFGELFYCCAEETGKKSKDKKWRKDVESLIFYYQPNVHSTLMLSLPRMQDLSKLSPLLLNLLLEYLWIPLDKKK